ncbi:hypothetical protein HPB48_019426 [Haemaphysalis longicornis]|uniref:Uncharacterized protein n=1 Tax=Haemaphysalis longicornis TaxID=44386 RepID=A0A9J6GM78_HAELO|nr:hypothetical protein HPB48_019426 [Haemaphysalis longicornis]
MAPTTRKVTEQKESPQGSGEDAAADAVMREAAEQSQPADLASMMRQMTAMFAEITRTLGTAVAERITLGGVPTPRRVQTPASVGGGPPPETATRPTKGGSGRGLRPAASDLMAGGGWSGVPGHGGGPSVVDPPGTKKLRSAATWTVVADGAAVSYCARSRWRDQARAERGTTRRGAATVPRLDAGGSGRRAAAGVLRGRAEGAVRHLRHPRRQLGRPPDWRPAPGADGEEPEGGAGRSCRRGRPSLVGAVRANRRARGGGRAGVDGHPPRPAHGRRTRPGVRGALGMCGEPGAGGWQARARRPTHRGTGPGPQEPAGTQRGGLAAVCGPSGGGH